MPTAAAQAPRSRAVPAARQTTAIRESTVHSAMVAAVPSHTSTAAAAGPATTAGDRVARAAGVSKVAVAVAVRPSSRSAAPTGVAGGGPASKSPSLRPRRTRRPARRLPPASARPTSLDRLGLRLGLRDHGLHGYRDRQHRCPQRRPDLHRREHDVHRDRADSRRQLHLRRRRELDTGQCELSSVQRGEPDVDAGRHHVADVADRPCRLDRVVRRGGERLPDS